jgi:hypothetical protein
MIILILTGILIEVAIIICSLKLWVEANDLKRENIRLKRDLGEALRLYSSLVRQIKEKNLK